MWNQRALQSQQWWAVGSGQWAVGSGQWAVGSGRMGGENFRALVCASQLGQPKVQADQSDESFGAHSEILTLQPTFCFSPLAPSLAVNATGKNFIGPGRDR